MLGIIGAMDEEVAQIKEKMTDVTVTSVAGMDFYQGKLGGKDAVVVRSGIGKVNAGIRCYRHAWHHGWNECRYDRYWSQRHHWHCVHGCRHWREWCCNWIRHSFRRSNRRVHRRADQVGIWTACTNRHRHFPCLRSHSAACRPCLRHEDVRAV